jgi:AraC family transcriptional activator of mtrCDE
MQITHNITHIHDEMNLPPDFPFFYERSRLEEKDMSNYSLHTHECFEIGICHRGHGVYLLDGSLYYFNPGDITVVPPMIPHMGAAGKNEICEWSWLFFSVESLLGSLINHGDFFSRPISGTFLKGPHKVFLTGLYHGLIEEAENPTRYYHDTISLNLGSLYLEVLKQIPLREDSLSNEKDRRENHRGLARIRSSLYHIHNNYHRNITIDDLAGLCAMSRTNFQIQFTRHMGISPYKYIIRFRLSMACGLLLKESMNIEQAAFECGFPTLSCFVRQFKQLKGMAPGQWKKASLI